MPFVLIYYVGNNKGYIWLRKQFFIEFSLWLMQPRHYTFTVLPLLL